MDFIAGSAGSAVASLAEREKKQKQKDVSSRWCCRETDPTIVSSYALVAGAAGLFLRDRFPLLDMLKADRPWICSGNSTVDEFCNQTLKIFRLGFKRGLLMTTEQTENRQDL